MVERSNRTIKQAPRQMCQEEHQEDWDEHLPYIRMALNATKHSATGLTPHMLFFSRCEEMLLPIDLAYGRAEVKTWRCHTEYIFKQKIMVQEMCELARKVTSRAMQIQKSARERAGLLIRKYQPGDEILRHWPPNARNKLHPSPWTGPHTVIRADDQFNDVLLDIRGVGGSIARKWVNVQNIKPYIRPPDGRPLNVNTIVGQLPPTKVELALLAEEDRSNPRAGLSIVEETSLEPSRTSRSEKTDVVSGVTKLPKSGAGLDVGEENPHHPTGPKKVKLTEERAGEGSK
jgi:hypothetical protein